MKRKAKISKKRSIKKKYSDPNILLQLIKEWENMRKINII